MTGRRTITAALERRIIMAQLAEGSFRINIARFAALLQCPICGESIEPDHAVIHEHMTPLAMGGEDTEDNIRLVHKRCATRKTYGSKATSYGSDSHAYHKGRRIRGETCTAPKRKIPRRADPWGKERKERQREDHMRSLWQRD